MEFPKTKDPDKWIKDVALSNEDFMDNKIGNEDLNDFCARLGLPRPKIRFENGKAVKND